MAFNEDSRVKIPAILHLARLGYTYLPLKDHSWNPQTNIFEVVSRDALARINPNATPDDLHRTLQEISLLLDNEDLGKAFHERLLRSDGIRLIDFEKFDNNTFNVVTELTCKNGDDEFRPDITLLINGMPLFFMEVQLMTAHQLPLTVEGCQFISNLVIKEYLDEFNGAQPA